MACREEEESSEPLTSQALEKAQGSRCTCGHRGHMHQELGAAQCPCFAAASRKAFGIPKDTMACDTKPCQCVIPQNGQCSRTIWTRTPCLLDSDVPVGEGPYTRQVSEVSVIGNKDGGWQGQEKGGGREA